MYGQIVIFLVFVPCLLFQGAEGKMFSPMVITLMLALASAFLLSVTVVPAMAAILLRGRVAESEVAAIRVAKRLYAPALRMSLAHPVSAVAAGLVTFGGVSSFRLAGLRFHPDP